MATKKTTTRKTTKKVPAAETKKEIKPLKEKFFQGLGRRKTSVAQVRIFPVSKKISAPNDILINGRAFSVFFTIAEMQDIVTAPMRALDLGGSFRVEVKVKGGGIHGQAEAVRLGIARAVKKYDEKYTKTLRDLGFLTRDARKVERKKPGLKKARRAPQWQKR